MKLAELLADILATNLETEINGLSIDSRHLQNGNAFIALQGSAQHGLTYREQAISRGAKAILYDPIGWELPLPTDVSLPHLAIPELDQHLGRIAAKFYDEPTKKLAVIGITGTNGKTTCSQLIAQALPTCGVIGTLGWGTPGNLLPLLNTTPDALSIQHLLAQFVKQQKSAVAMEVSSHGLQQGRVNGVVFTGAVFTNLSRDHLDYHGDMETYLQAKLRLFRQTALKFAVLNADDPACLSVLDNLAETVTCWTFSAKGLSIPNVQSVIARQVNFSSEGIHFEAVYGDHHASAFTPLIGEFNLENVLTVLTVLLALGLEFSDAVLRLANLTAIVGRMEKFGGNDKPTVFVDYAHSPDALEKVLKAVNTQGRLWLVFGCGGDRDKGKRSEMGHIAENLADRIILTDDNPRHESPVEIINDILTGCNDHNITVINDRRLAITTAIQQASKEDCVLVAGKGHEFYQEINGIKLPFSDQAVVKQSLANWTN